MSTHPCCVSQTFKLLLEVNGGQVASPFIWAGFPNMLFFLLERVMYMTQGDPDLEVTTWLTVMRIRIRTLILTPYTGVMGTAMRFLGT